MQEEVKSEYGLMFDELPPALKMCWLTANNVYPSCTESLIKLFDQMCTDKTVSVTGEPGCAKSFNVVLLLLFFHTHGLDGQLSGLFCNQKTHVQAGYKNVWKAMKFYQDVTGEPQPLSNPDRWPFLMVTGDEVMGNKHFSQLKLVFNTAATSDD